MNIEAYFERNVTLIYRQMSERTINFPIRIFLRLTHEGKLTIPVSWIYKLSEINHFLNITTNRFQAHISPLTVGSKIKQASCNVSRGHCCEILTSGSRNDFTNKISIVRGIALELSQCGFFRCSRHPQQLHVGFRRVSLIPKTIPSH